MDIVSIKNFPSIEISSLDDKILEKSSSRNNSIQQNSETNISIQKFCLEIRSTSNLKYPPSQINLPKINISIKNEYKKYHNSDGTNNDDSSKKILERIELIQHQIDKWKELYMKKFGVEFSEIDFSDKMNKLNELPFTQRIIIRRGVTIINKLADQMKLYDFVEENKNKEINLIEIKNFAENYFSRNDIFFSINLKENIINDVSFKYPFHNFIYNSLNSEINNKSLSPLPDIEFIKENDNFLKIIILKIKECWSEISNKSFIHNLSSNFNKFLKF